jgi:uncharacterized membrane protein
MIILQILNVLLLVGAIVSFAWMVIGTPVGIILIIVNLLTKDQKQKLKLKKWIRICFLGILTMVVIALFYAFMQVVAYFFGVNVFNDPANLKPY